MSVTTRVSSLMLTTLAAFAFTLQGAQKAPATGNETVSMMLASVDREAFQLRTDATELERAARSHASWETNAAAIDRVREDVNRMAKMLNDLEAKRGAAEPWQQTAIDRMLPAMRELAGNTSAAILKLNESRRDTPSLLYEKNLDTVASSAWNLADLIAQFNTYDHTRERLSRLAGKLELPGESNRTVE